MEALFVSAQDEISRIEVFDCTLDDIAWIGREPMTAFSKMLDAIDTKLGVHLGYERTDVLPKSRLCRPMVTGDMAVQRCASVSCTFTNGAEFPLWSSLSCNSKTPCTIGMKFYTHLEDVLGHMPAKFK